MSLKFGTSGLRGLALDLLDGAAARFAAAFVAHLVASGHARAGDRIFVGQDLRDSSPAIADQCIAALRRAGMAPMCCGALPTPALALYASGEGAAAIMVSGSHIPADRNGLKFYRPDGEIDKEDEESILSFSRTPCPADGDAATLPPDAADAALALYRERCLSVLPEGALSGLRVGLYQHSSVARDFMAELIAAYGAKVVPLGRSERFVPVDTEAVDEETQAAFRRWARAHRLDAIVSTDADADRPLVVDERGEQIRGDVLGVIAARFLKVACVATPVTSNSAIERALGIETLRTRVGSPFVIEAMQKAASERPAGPVAGFEANGGFLLATPARASGGMLAALPTRDGALPILTALALAATAPLSSHVAALALPVCLSGRLENFPVADSKALMERLEAGDDQVAALLSGLGRPDRIDRTDGLRVTLEDGGIVHLRPSGNAPEMRCYVEAASPAAATALLRAIMAKLRP